jgi:CRISPR-associated protein Cas5d
VPTYEAMKGVLQSIYWKPTITWIIDSVRVMNQIQTETKGIRPIKYSGGGNDLSYYTYLKNCRYQVRAHFIWNENRPELSGDRNENKHHNIARRMIERGGRRDIFLGTRECQGYVGPCAFGDGKGFYDETPQLDFGVMYHGITYADEAYSEETKGKMTVRLWRAVMKMGVIDFILPENCIHRPVRDMLVKPFGETFNNFVTAESEVV